MTPTRPYTGDIPETRTLSIFYKLKETDRGSPEPQRVGSNVTQQVRVTQPVSVAAAALESRGPLAPACGHNGEKGRSIEIAFLLMNVPFTMAVNDAAKLADFKQRLAQYLWI